MGLFLFLAQSASAKVRSHVLMSFIEINSIEVAPPTFLPKDHFGQVSRTRRLRRHPLSRE